jgi:hypothetical protein
MNTGGKQDSDLKKMNSLETRNRKQDLSAKSSICFLCGLEGHRKTNCPKLLENK